jgi:zinc/manganese transport system substrate-binding protein
MRIQRFQSTSLTILALCGGIYFSENAFAKLNVLTTTTTLKSIAEVVGGGYVNVNSITKGSQDPHFIEAKPSYMVKARRTDLLVSIGMDLEIGWLPNIIRGARNPSITGGNMGFLETGVYIDPIEVSQGKVDRSLGDIHARGNPHFILDPKRAIVVAQKISDRFSKLDPSHQSTFAQNTADFKLKIENKMQDWSDRIQAAGVKDVITYHKTLNYFLKRFNMRLLGSIEPKAGIPPTARHILSLIDAIKVSQASCILIESYFESSAVKRIEKSVPIQIEVVAAEVGATKTATNYQALIESLVVAIEKCGTLVQKSEVKK